MVCRSLAGVSHTERYVVSSDSGVASASSTAACGVCAVGSDACVADAMRDISLCGALTTDDVAGFCNDAAGRLYLLATLLIVSSFIRSATITTTATEAAADIAKATRRMVLWRLRLLGRGAGAVAMLSSRRSAILSHNPSGTVAFGRRDVRAACWSNRFVSYCVSFVVFLNLVSQHLLGVKILRSRCAGRYSQFVGYLLVAHLAENV